jgi:hypothetical protein
VQLLSRIRTTFEVELLLRALFDTATLADLAAAVDRAAAVDVAATAPIARMPRERYRVRVSEGGALELDDALRETLHDDIRGSA